MLLDVDFLRRGLQVSKGVCRITVDIDGEMYNGTGFRIAPSFVLTNYHVLFDMDNHDTKAESVEIWFNYERRFGLAEPQPFITRGVVDSIVGDVPHDWAVVEVEDALPDDIPIIQLGTADMTQDR